MDILMLKQFLNPVIVPLLKLLICSLGLKRRTLALCIAHTNITTCKQCELTLEIAEQCFGLHAACLW